MAWRVTTNNHVRRDVLGAHEVEDSVLEELGLDPDNDEDMSRDVIRYGGTWLDLYSFLTDLPDELREQGWQGWLPRGAGNADPFAWLVKFGMDSFDHSLPVLGHVEAVED